MQKNKRMRIQHIFIVTIFSLPQFLLAQKYYKKKSTNAFNYTIDKQKKCSKYAIATAHPIASNIGAKIMQQGGNAFDAAIAVQLALAVVYPGAGNIGGGGFMVAQTSKGKQLALDYRETAPMAATKNMYLDSNGNANANLSQNGHKAVGVPGTIAGIFEMMPYAKLSFETLINPAIELAKKGFVITQNEANNLTNLHQNFIDNNTQKNSFTAKQVWQQGDTLVQPQLAATLQRIKLLKLKGFYEGETAQFIVDEMARGKGIITLDDLKNYTAKWRKPLQFFYKNYEIVTMPPPSSGGIILGQLLNMMDAKNLSSKVFQSKAAVQLMVEAERLAFADRATHLCDPDFYKVPVSTLLSTQYCIKRFANYDSTKPANSNDIKAGEIKESEETTHISIADELGNVVSITTTLNGSYGSKTVVGGAGFFLNNEMDDFSSKAGVANMYGAVGGIANAIAPKKRMLSSMTPTLVLKNKQPFLVVGSPGGTTIPTSVFQTIVNVIDFKLSALEAVNKPKFHHQWLPNEVFIEKNFDAEVAKQLQKMGYTITPRGNIGRVELIKITNKSKEVIADFRGDDSVAGE
jgi:gamma-glutamyltranspeptidase / glutathione hydrolase